MWAYLVHNLEDADQTVKAVFWGAHQRFFKSLFVAAKVHATWPHVRCGRISMTSCSISARHVV